MMDAIIESLSRRFPLTKRDAGEYAHFKASPLSVDLDWYAAEGLGNVSILHGKAMAGLMQMDTLVINAVARDVPLFSYDYIAAMGNHTMLVEYFDTTLGPARFNDAPFTAAKEAVAALPVYDLGSHWYDSIKLPVSFAVKTKKHDLGTLRTAFQTAFDAYLTLAAESPVLSEEDQAKKRKAASMYVDGLLQNGGPCADSFSKAIGKERTRDLFTRIVFGTEV